MLTNHNKECAGGRVRHVATHRETIKTTTGTFGLYVCREHFSKPKDWENDGWDGVRISRSRL